jgi:hypothetical protein
MKKPMIILFFTLLSIAAAKTYSSVHAAEEKFPLSFDLYQEPPKVNILIKRTINRKKQNALGCTPGKLYVNGQYFCRTLEKPYTNAERNISSIHPGIYRAHLRYIDNKSQWRIQIQPITTWGYGDDPFIANRIIVRDGIQIHPGTKPEHSQGCILVGLQGAQSCELSQSHETFNRLLNKYFGSSECPDQNIKIVVIIQTDYKKEEKNEQ